MASKCCIPNPFFYTPSTHVSTILDNSNQLLVNDDDLYEDKEIFAILHHLPFEDAVVVNNESLVIESPPSRCENHFMKNSFFQR
ncbi:Uncharacterized protein QTN25_001176 [Entamoeba marina]